ncbi:MAG TPA: WecB/TagA/CpsF family glycosyltransferase [Candidatus Pacebacteria bacterium]|nr:WecB/TagA/CpsF family glycosyltransferase [Candidatus Paceibacterota bacterium]
MGDTSKLCILNTRIDNLSKESVIKCINYFLKNNKFNQIATINPEFLLEARKNNKFHNALVNSDLNVADGIGVKFAFWRYKKHLKARYSGVDLMWDILEIANINKLNIYLVANKEGLSTWQETRDAILKVYPKLKINGNNINKQYGILNGQVEDYIMQSNIVFVNFGAPHQEIFINSLKNNTQSSLQLGMGVGGSFDYITGKVSRAPKFMRNAGLEWLYRLIKQPQRCKRIWNAVVVFPIIILLTNNDGQKYK